jgi:hypothetical protein
MTSRHENLAVGIKNCKLCRDSCDQEFCHICMTCMSDDFKKTLHKTHREHQRRGEFSRIFPKRGYENLVKLMTRDTRLLSQWFEMKCDEDSEWC